MEKLTLTFITSQSRDPDGVLDYIDNLTSALKSHPDLTVNKVNKKTISSGFSQLPDYVVFNFPFLNRSRLLFQDYLILVQAVLHSKVVLNLHEWKNLKFFRRISLLIFLVFAHRVIFPSKRVYESMPKVIKKYLLKDKFRIVPISANVILNPDNFNGSKKREHFKIGMFGLGYESKNFDLALKICSLVVKEGFKVDLIWAGTYLNQDYQRKIDAYAEQLSLDGGLNFVKLGNVLKDDLDTSKLAECDFFFALHDESFDVRHGSSLTLLSTGLPVICLKPEQISMKEEKLFDNLFLYDRNKIIDEIIDDIRYLKALKIESNNIRKWSDVADEFINGITK